MGSESLCSLKFFSQVVSVHKKDRRSSLKVSILFSKLRKQKKMGLFSNEISRYEVRRGDHIYSWRPGFIYAHHGIYVGNGKVIHFTSRPKTFITSWSPNHPCPTCKNSSQLEDGIFSCCLNCFLAGGSLYRYKYSESSFIFLAKPRGGACTTRPSDPPEEVVYRAEYLLEKGNGFGDYSLFTNNCESFAMYCKTGLIFKEKAATSSQGFAGNKALKIITGGIVVTGFATMGGTIVGVAVGSLVVLPSCIGIATCVNIHRLMSDKRQRRKVAVEHAS